MRTILYLLQKEFLQIFRNRGMLPIIFVMPVLQLLVLSYAATFEVKETRVSLLDEDRTATSRLLAERLARSGYFTVTARPSAAAADHDLLAERADLLLRVPAHFERDLRRGGAVPVQLILDAQDGATAGVVQAYVANVLAAFNRDLQVEARAALPEATTAPAGDLDAGEGIRTVATHWYNPGLDYQTYMVPGILVLLVTMIAMFLSAMNVVREKEIGTMEQLNVTPIRRYQFIVGKLLPFWIIALLELAFGLFVARLVFRVPVLGNLLLVFGLAGLYLLVVLGIGLWISTITETQQQAMFTAWFIMVVFILMSGLFTPIESMPGWAQRLTLLNPIAYFVEIMRRVLLKGAGFAAVQVQFWSLLAYAALMLTLAVRQYRKVGA